MNSFDVLSAINANASLLSEAKYIGVAEPYIHVLKGLFYDLEQSLKDEKSAPDAVTTEAEKESTTATDYTKSDALSIPDGKTVQTPSGIGVINHRIGAKSPVYVVDMDNGGSLIFDPEYVIPIGDDDA